MNARVCFMHMHHALHSVNRVRARATTVHALCPKIINGTRHLYSWSRKAVVPANGLFHQRQEQAQPLKEPKIDPRSSMPFLDFRTNDSRNVYYTKNREEANQWLSENHSKMFAFDAEWKPYTTAGRQGRISLIQLGDERDIYLFHVHHMDKFPEELQKILESERILKVGINIGNDVRKLWKDWNIASASLVELGALCIQVLDGLKSRRKVRSMTSLAEELLGHAVAKEPFLRTGDWEGTNLSARQLAYAANDAFVTYEVAQRIKDLQQQRSQEEFTIPLQTIQQSGASDVKVVRGTLDKTEREGFTAADIVVQPLPATEATSGKKFGEDDVKEHMRSQSTRTTLITAGRKRPRMAASTKEPKTTRRGRTKAKSPEIAPQAITTRIYPSPSLGTSDSLPLPEPIAFKYTSGQWTRTIIPASSSFFQKSTNQQSLIAVKAQSSSTPASPLVSSVDRGVISSTTPAKIVKHYGRTTVEIIPPWAQTRQPKNKASFSTFVGRAMMRSCHAGQSTGRLASDGAEEEATDTNNTLPHLPRHLLPPSMEGLDILERNQAIWRETAGDDASEDLEDESLQDSDWHLRQNETLLQSIYSSITEEDDADHRLDK